MFVVRSAFLLLIISFVLIGRARQKAIDGKIISLIEEATKANAYLRVGEDDSERPVFIGAQIAFEQLFAQLLASGELKRLTCVIHAPAPATPLCTEGEISKGLAAPELLNDPSRISTIKKRPEILRDLLAAGACIYSVYQRGGRSVRSPEQLEVLDRLLKQYPRNLVAAELTCDTIPESLIGAIYFLEFGGEPYVLILMSSQACEPSGEKWGIWFGRCGSEAIRERLASVLPFLNDHGLSDIMSEL